MGCKLSTPAALQMPVAPTPATLRRQESLGTALGWDEFNQSLDDIFVDIFNVDLHATRGSTKIVSTVTEATEKTEGENRKTLNEDDPSEENTALTAEKKDKVSKETEKKEMDEEEKEKEETNKSKMGVIAKVVSKMKVAFVNSVSKESEPRVSMNPNSLAPLPEGFSPAQSEEFTKKEAAAKRYVDVIEDVEEGDGSGLMAPVAGLMEHHKYSGQKNSSKVAKMKPFMKELTRNLPKNLKADPNGSIFVRFDEDRPSFLQAIITGVIGTPYENGCFLFDIHCPNNYPDTNPAVTHTTPGAASVTANNGPGGFSPNLHKGTGKVCLSLLGTWSGQGWDKNKHSIYTVLSSIMWGILGAEHPYYNEPGHGGWEGTAPTTGHSSKVIEYDSRVMVGTCRYAIAGMIKNPPKGFEKVLRAHFKAKEAEIRETMKTWTKACNSTNKTQLQTAIKEVQAALDTLK